MPFKWPNRVAMLIILIIRKLVSGVSEAHECFPASPGSLPHLTRASSELTSDSLIGLARQDRDLEGFLLHTRLSRHIWLQTCSVNKRGGPEAPGGAPEVPGEAPEVPE